MTAPPELAEAQARVRDAEMALLYRIVPSGYCHCGDSLDAHHWANHTPVEMDEPVPRMLWIHNLLCRIRRMFWRLGICPEAAA